MDTNDIKSARKAAKDLEEKLAEGARHEMARTPAADQVAQVLPYLRYLEQSAAATSVSGGAGDWLPIYMGADLPPAGEKVYLINNYGNAAKLAPRRGMLRECLDGYVWYLDGDSAAWDFGNFTHYLRVPAYPSTEATVRRAALAASPASVTSPQEPTMSDSQLAEHALGLAYRHCETEQIDEIGRLLEEVEDSRKPTTHPEYAHWELLARVHGALWLFAQTHAFNAWAVSALSQLTESLIHECACAKELGDNEKHSIVFAALHAEPAAARSLGVAEPGGWSRVEESLPPDYAEVWAAIRPEYIPLYSRVVRGKAMPKWIDFQDKEEIYRIARESHLGDVPIEHVSHWQLDVTPKYPATDGN